MGLCLLLIIALIGGSEELVIDIPAPDYHLLGDRIEVAQGNYLPHPGAPKLPCRTLCLALPPGALVESAHFTGERSAVGRISLPPVEPVFPLSDGHASPLARQAYEKQKNRIYSSNRIYPEAHGAIRSKGGLRRYTLIDVACYHFAYRPKSKTLYYAPEITVTIKYSMPDSGHERARFYERMKNDVTFDETAKDLIYNWQQARVWYRTNQPRTAKGYCIILPGAIQNAVSALAAWRQSQGYDVNIVTTEYIEANTVGDDLQQKIRYYLREHLADTAYVLLVGLPADVPWRSLVPFNDNPYSPYGSQDYSPIPSDLYYAELSDPDHLSWNSDGDDYYGEVYDDYLNPLGDDDPDYHADVHLGRIPFKSISMIQDICDKTIAFDGNTDRAYKTASLLAGSIYYFENENYSGNNRLDGAEFMEELLYREVLDPSKAVTLYEASGLNPCYYPCTAPLTQANTIAYWQQRGIFYECHHGSYDYYARKVWAWDDGDGVPENKEIQWPTSLHKSDVYKLDNAYPATTFLRSCLCGKPEVTGIGAMLLYRGASAVISSSRVAWLSLSDPGGIPFHFYERLLKRTLSSKGIIGMAYDLARNDFMETSGFWLPAYHYNLFGDPALRQFGRVVHIDEPPIKPTK